MNVSAEFFLLIRDARSADVASPTAARAYSGLAPLCQGDDPPIPPQEVAARPFPREGSADPRRMVTDGNSSLDDILREISVT